MADIVPLSTGHNLATGAVVDHFDLAAKPAQETLNAVLKLRGARIWLEEWRDYDPSYSRLLIDRDRMVELYALIPDEAFLQRAGKLIDDAERKSAPEAWFHLALGSMLAQMPNSKNVAPDYQFGIVDSIMHDEEVWGRYGPGFSAPVFVCALREARRKSDFVPGAATILDGCQRHRRRFRELGEIVSLFAKVRDSVEHWTEDQPTPEDWSDCPF